MKLLAKLIMILIIKTSNKIKILTHDNLKKN
jgi:hypothetical protein